MRKRNEAKLIHGWGWLEQVAEDAAVPAMAPARPLKNASPATAAIKGKQKTAAARVSGIQLTDDHYRQLAKQQHESEGKIEIDPHGRVSRFEDHTGEIGAYVQAWVFVYKPERK